MTEEIAIKTLISEIKYELQKIVPLKDDMKLLTASFGDKTPDKFNCSAVGMYSPVFSSLQPLTSC